MHNGGFYHKAGPVSARRWGEKPDRNTQVTDRKINNVFLLICNYIMKDGCSQKEATTVVTSHTSISAFCYTFIGWGISKLLISLECDDATTIFTLSPCRQENVFYNSWSSRPDHSRNNEVYSPKCIYYRLIYLEWISSL